MDSSEPIPPEPIPPDTNIPERESQETASPATTIVLMEQRLADIFERLQVLRSLPVSAELVDELSAIRFDGAMISRDLRALGDEVLLTLGVRSMEDPEELVPSVACEMADDCEWCEPDPRRSATHAGRH